MSPSASGAMTDIYYFGVWIKGQAGHYLYRPDGSCLYGPNPLPWHRLDGCLAPGGTMREEEQIEGRAILHQTGGWTALSFWDRSGDRRFGSNSNFFANGIYSLDEMMGLARLNFPSICDRFTFEVR